jgi:hypothetical protein
LGEDQRKERKEKGIDEGTGFLSLFFLFPGHCSYYFLCVGPGRKKEERNILQFLIHSFIFLLY